jgi:hypothetical protein
MSGERWRELHGRGPIDIIAKPMPPSARRARKSQKHTQTGPYRDTVGLARGRRHQRQSDGSTWRVVFDPSPDLKVWHTTQHVPWQTRARRRARNRIARATRKANRR